MLLPASRTHARKVALERAAAVKFQAFPSVVLWKGDAAAVQRLRTARVLLEAQLQSFALDADRRRNNAPAVANSASARNLVENVIAARIDILPKTWLNDQNDGETGDRPCGQTCLVARPA